MPISNYHDHIDMGGAHFGEGLYFSESYTCASESLRFVGDDDVIYIGIARYKSDSYNTYSLVGTLSRTTLNGLLGIILNQADLQRFDYYINIVDLRRKIDKSEIKPDSLYFNKRGDALFSIEWGEKITFKDWRENNYYRIITLPISVDNEEVILYTMDGVMSLKTMYVADCNVGYIILDDGILNKYDSYLKSEIRNNDGSVHTYYQNEHKSIDIGEIL